MHRNICCQAYIFCDIQVIKSIHPLPDKQNPSCCQNPSQAELPGPFALLTLDDPPMSSATLIYALFPNKNLLLLAHKVSLYTQLG